MSTVTIGVQTLAKEYWKKELQVPLPTLDLPTDYQKHHVKGKLSKTVSFPLNEFSLKEVENWVNKNNVDIQTFFLSSYCMLLHRLTNESEIMLGVHKEKDHILPIRVSFETEKTASSIMKQVNEKLKEAHIYENFNWKEYLTDEENDAYYTTFSFNDFSIEEHTYLDCRLLIEGTQLSLVINYNENLFLLKTVERYVHYYEKMIYVLLQSETSEVNFNSIPIISIEEQGLYEILNQTFVPYERNKTINQIFSETASVFPNRTAISSNEGSLTYEQLEEQSNRVAQMLLENGLQKEELVAIFMNRSIETIISLLGVLKAGGAYVPLDPEHPIDRNKYILENTSSRFAIVRTPYFNKFKQLVDEDNELCIFTENDFEKYSNVPTTVELTQDNLAYIIYTSGSTGRPKGTLICHRGVVNLIDWSTKEMNFTEEDVLCQFAPYSFDASIYDTFSALFKGAHLYLLSDEERMSVEAFSNAVEREGVTSIAILPTIFFNELVAKLPDEYVQRFKNVRQITIAGEALITEFVISFREKFGKKMDIYNLYGPTECTVLSTFYKVTDDMPLTPTVPIGYPLNNYALYIVNEMDKLCPVGVTGELLISTGGIARGYLKEAEKTAAVFVPNHFGDDFSPIMYRSGDLVRLLPSGEIEYVSRKDTQIKIRGHRIEIGEVEHALAEVDHIRDVAIIAKQDDDGLNMLVAFYTTLTGEGFPQSYLRDFLSEKLPKYMVPSYFQFLNELPVSPTGKIDRRTLSTIELVKEETRKAENLPRTETEVIISEAWKKSLRLAEIDIYDDFFEIGGHSLKILETLVLLKPAFPQLKINDFFLNPTIEKLALRALELSQLTPLEKQNANAAEEIIDLIENPISFGSKQSAKLLNQNEILLTGATGYLGSHILQELLLQTEANVYCLVRGSSAEHAEDRLWETINYYFGENLLKEAQNRVVVVKGDLEKEELGLFKEDRELLQKHIDSIIHCGADVRHYGDYEHFSKVNKQSTEYLLEFAKSKDGLRFHYISTLGIPEDLALEGKWESTQSINELLNISLQNVYTNSKLESEKILFQAAEKYGIPITIYRAGNLSCHSKTGMFQKNIDSNAYYRMLKTMLTLKAAPKVEWFVDYTPIDYASGSIVALFKQDESVGRILHICNHEQIHYSKMIDYMKQCGYKVELKERAEYESWLFSENGIDPEILQLTIAQLEGDGAKDSNYRYACPETKNLLKGTGIICPNINEEFFTKMINYAVKVGYFPEH
ncbi:amino acid adenylation domain-containing protein [Metabacillus fastidiosus]|uniref:non-ribosomal peptide synthetase family protein n=1 Tax=Metabacillus fastidiosus TaxID=1458 RepID=UPI003D2B7E29